MLSTHAPGRSGVILTYGTFDMFHIGHLQLLRRLRDMGTQLIVGVSTDEFNARKGKRAVVPFDDRAAIVAGVRYVDHVIAEHDWAQKRGDILAHDVEIFGMGDDWLHKFDDLTDLCRVVYLPRTPNISSTEIKVQVRQGASPGMPTPSAQTVHA
jgi:glycerol-3-phosphate cytidylyltransferase